MNDMNEAVSQDSKNMGIVIWALTIFFSFIPSLVFYLMRKDDDYLQDQAKEALNWSITVMIAYAASTVLAFILVGFLTGAAVWLANIIVCILGAIDASNGKRYRAFFALRLIK